MYLKPLTANFNSYKKYEKGKCYFKIDYDRDSIGDTYSTLSNSFLNSGGIISDNVKSCLF